MMGLLEPFLPYIIGAFAGLAVVIGAFFKGRSAGKKAVEGKLKDERLEAIKKSKENENAVKESSDDELIDGITRRR